MIGLGLLRGVFLGGIMMWYTMSVWKTVDQYFRDQFQEYLTKEYEQNSAMKKDVLIEKERLDARKVLLDKLEKLDTAGVGQQEPAYGDFEGPTGGMPSYGTEPADGRGWSLGRAASDHGEYSAEEVVVSGAEEGAAGWREEEDVGEAGAGPPYEEEEEEDEGGTGEQGECLVEDCGGHGGELVAPRWRNVFDEDGDVCRLEDQHLAGGGPCSQSGEEGVFWDGKAEDDGE